MISQALNAETGNTISKMRLPIYPKDEKSEYHSFDDKVAILISRVALTLLLESVLIPQKLALTVLSRKK